MASPYNTDPDWYYGPKYVEIIALPPLSSDIYFDGRATVGPSWDFENSEICKWLEENCKEKYNYVWGIELDDDRMLIHVGFVKEEHVKDFKEKFETFDWNIECEEGRILINVHQLFYPSEGYNDDDFYEKITEAIQWCRENLQSLWKYHHHGQTGMFFYFRCENDAAAFKLRFL